MEEETVTVPPPGFLEMLNISLKLKDFSNVSRSFDPVVSDVDFWFALVTFSILACLGILGNLFSICVWQADKKFSATTFLFKSVAGWDIAFLGLATGYNFIIRDRRLLTSQALVLSFYHGTNFAQMVSVHVTLLLAQSRWMVAVFVTEGGPQFLTRKLICSMSGFIVTYCAGLQAVQGVYNNYYPRSPTLFVPKELFGLVLPLVCLLVFNVGLIRAVTRKSEALQDAIHGGTAQQTARRQMVKAVVLMSIFSFVAYLVGTLVKMHSIKNYSTVPDVVVSQLASLCQVANSSINVFIFWVFLGNFRKLARDRCRCLCPRLLSERGMSHRPGTRMELTPLPTRQGRNQADTT